MFKPRNIIKHYGGGGGTQTVETIPSWARPYMENVGKASEAAYTSGQLGNVAGASDLQEKAFTSASGIEAAGTGAATNLTEQQARLKEMAATGGRDELMQAAAYESAKQGAGLANEFGGSGVLGSARHNLKQGAMEAEMLSKANQQVLQNKLNAEQALGTSTGQSLSAAGSTASNLAALGETQRGIEQQQADSAWQALQRYSSAVYGNPARQQAVSGGK